MLDQLNTSTPLSATKAENNILSIKWVSSQADIPADLWQKCFPPPLEGRWWYSVLENCGLEDQFIFSYGLLSQDGKPIGIVPIFLNDVPIELVAPEKIAPILR